MKKRTMNHNLEELNGKVVYHPTEFASQERDNERFLNDKRVIDKAHDWWSPNRITDVLNCAVNQNPDDPKNKEQGRSQGDEFARAADEFVKASGANCIFVNSLPTDQSNEDNIKTS